MDLEVGDSRFMSWRGILIRRPHTTIPACRRKCLSTSRTPTLPLGRLTAAACFRASHSGTSAILLGGHCPQRASSHSPTAELLRQAGVFSADPLLRILVQFFQVQQQISRSGEHPDQLVELDLKGYGVPILGVLNKED